MRHSKAAWLAWALCALGVALALAELIYSIRAPGTADVGESLFGTLISIVFGLVGALIVSRQPRQIIGWLVLIVGSSFAVGSLVSQWAQTLPAAVELTPVTLLVLSIGAWSWWLLLAPLLLISLLFPTGQLLSPRWRWVVALLALSFVFFVLSITFPLTITLPNATTPLPNPAGFLPDAVAQALYAGFQWSLPVAALASAAAMFVRYRRSGTVQRHQIKWVAYAITLFIAGFILQFVLETDTSGGFLNAVIGLVFVAGILSIPLSIGIAILRYRLWDIDLLIRRTLVYALLTGLLALAYFSSVLVLQNIFGALTGQSQSTLVTVLSTLVIAALFVPLRHRVQAVIDRRLYRRKYDAARTLAAFSSQLRDETNLEHLSVHLLDVVNQTMQPENVNLWLAPGGTRRESAHD